MYAFLHAFPRLHLMMQYFACNFLLVWQD